VGGGGVFVSYRRADSQGWAGRLAADLSQRLGPEAVFSDIEIPPGSDYPGVLRDAIAGSDAVLVVIGPRWMAGRRDGEPSRLFEPDDWVRTEIEAAFVADRPVLPVLVGQATMPAESALPAPLRPLSRRQAASLDDRHWEADIEALLRDLRRLAPGLVPRAPPPAAVERPSPAPVAPGRSPWPLRAISAIARALARTVSLGMRRTMVVVVLLALAWGAARLFGDPPLQRRLDVAEARLAQTWDRVWRSISGP
jgi:hypothetical protein